MMDEAEGANAFASCAERSRMAGNKIAEKLNIVMEQLEGASGWMCC